MLRFDHDHAFLQGPSGALPVPDDDEITRELAMLVEGQCEGMGPKRAARKFGYSPQRYFQLLHDFQQRGAQAAVHQFRQRLGNPYRQWEARRLSRCLLQALDGDIRVGDDTILVTFYDAPNAQLRR